jgi:preprotein translocase subunit SecA
VRHGGLRRLVPAALVPPLQDAPIQNPIVAREIARAQRIIDGQHRDIRRTLAAYARVVEQQYEAVLELRHAWLEDDPAGVAMLDALWRQHLDVCAQYRETAHLARLGGRDPLDVYTSAVRSAFEGFEDALAGEQRPVPGRAGSLPSSTWTYLVNDDPFAHTIGAMLSGPGGPTIAIYAAALLGPLLLAWGAVDRWLRPGARHSPRGR